MADYIATARTNYFRVKDIEALRTELSTYGIETGSWSDYQAVGADLVLDDTKDNRPEGAIALFCYGSWPMLDADDTAMRLGLDFDDDTASVPADHETLVELVASHLVETDVAVFLEVGAEKMRYLGGLASAINARGETRAVDLDDIYRIAERELGVPGTPVTTANY